LGARVRRRLIHALLPAAIALTSTACRQDMQDQPRYEPLQKSDFFPDGRSAREIPANTVAAGSFDDTQPEFTGVKPDGGFLETIPRELTPALMHRGRERFDVFCSPCHGRLGDGNGMAAQRGVRWPPSFHTDRARRLPPGYVFAVITNGFGGMPDYSDQIPPDDRWAIIAYLRALQVSRTGTINDVPPGQRTSLPTLGGQP
jgi:hypothetical protein